MCRVTGNISLQRFFFFSCSGFGEGTTFPMEDKAVRLTPHAGGSHVGVLPGEAP